MVSICSYGMRSISCRFGFNWGVNSKSVSWNNFKMALATTRSRWTAWYSIRLTIKLFTKFQYSKISYLFLILTEPRYLTPVYSPIFCCFVCLVFCSLSQFVTLVSNHTHVNLCALSSLMMRVDESRHNSSSSVLTTPTLSRKIQRVLNHSSVTPSVSFMCVCVVLLGFGGFQVCVGQVYVCSAISCVSHSKIKSNIQSNHV